jgi:IS605 OrfB family transposase
MIKNKDYPLKNKDPGIKNVSLKQHLRNACVKDQAYAQENEWAKELPADTRDYAITELLKNFKTNLDHAQNFQMTFKSKFKSQSIEIRKRQYNASRGKYSFLSEIKKSEVLPEIEHDIKIQKDFIGNYYLCIPIGIKLNENQVPQKMISIDPGVRTFLTGYTPDGYMYHIGENDIQRICRLNHYKSKLQTRLTKQPGQRIKKAFNKVCEKIRNLINDCHKKIAKWLLSNFEYVIIPKLNTGSFLQKKMSKKVKNQIKAWSHCSFIKRLKMKNREYPNTKVIVPTEEYTSKTCSSCGEIHNKLGSNKTFNCPNCNLQFDRDANASLNILLKIVTETS